MRKYITSFPLHTRSYSSYSFFFLLFSNLKKAPTRTENNTKILNAEKLNNITVLKKKKQQKKGLT